LNIDLNQVMCPEELAALILAERLEVFFEGKQFMGIMRWMGNFLSNLDIKRPKPPELITILDYRWVLSLGQPLVVWDTQTDTAVHIKEMAKDQPPPEVSVAISLFAIWKRRVEPLHAQTASLD